MDNAPLTVANTFELVTDLDAGLAPPTEKFLRRAGALAQVTLYNSIVAHNSNADCDTIGASSQVDASHGYNLDTDGTCVTDGVDNNIAADPLLLPLADNSGDTLTHALQEGSPALDHIALGINGCGTTITTDQRGITRPQFGACDMGAYENAINFPPLAQNDAYTTTEEVTLIVVTPGVLGNDSDGNGDVITPTVQNSPANGMLAFSSDGSFTYTPTLDFAGTDSFTYLVSDGVLTDTAVVTITVTNINDTPTANDDSYKHLRTRH